MVTKANPFDLADSLIILAMSAILTNKAIKQCIMELKLIPQTKTKRKGAESSP